jgi:hypothetical protein
MDYQHETPSIPSIRVAVVRAPAAPAESKLPGVRLEAAIAERHGAFLQEMPTVEHQRSNPVAGLPRAERTEKVGLPGERAAR